MSCSNAPINIGTPAGPCQLKCEYNFDYTDSNCVVTNNGTYLLLSYDGSPKPPVIYNANTYQVREARIYFPSIHQYQGQTAAAELLIMHSSGSKNLIVSVPLIVSSSTSKTTRFLDQVADYVSSFVPSSGQSASMGNATWNLNDWVPEKKFYSYNGTAPFSPCASGYDYVVFSTVDSAEATISNSALNTIKRFIGASGIGVKSNTFYESTGIARQSLEQTDSEIYIACSPTSVSTEQEVVGVEREAPTNFFAEAGKFVQSGEFINNPFTIVILSAITMIGVYKIGNFIFARKRAGGSS